MEARYCGVCGQENLEPQEGVMHLVSHFFNDITHFDGKFFNSLKYLITRPGFLSKEYVAGRRVKYLNPVRMYIFTSFIFFFIFFTLILNTEDSSSRSVSNVERIIRDSVASAKKEHKIVDTANYHKMTFGSDGVDVGDEFSADTINYRDLNEYDSLISSGKLKHGFFKKLIQRKQIRYREKYGKDQVLLGETLWENIKHTIPQMFFFSLPFLALLLKLLYIRRKQFYYVAHAIFIIHLFIFVYIATLIIYGVSALSKLPFMGWLNYLTVALVITVFWYGYRAMRNFYQQGRLKTVFKYFLFLLGLWVILFISTVITMIYSFYKL